MLQFNYYLSCTHPHTPKKDDETFSSMGADEGSWTELQRTHRTLRIQSISAGMGEVCPLVLFPATGPSHCAAPAYSLRNEGRRQERHHLCGNLVFGPPYLTRRPCVFYACRTCLLTAVFPTHSASWAGLAVVRCATQTRHVRRTGERCRSEWHVLASVIVGERPRASQVPPLDPLSPLRCPS